MAEYRRIDAADRETYRRFTRYGFAAERGPPDPDDDRPWETDLFDRRGYYEDGELVSGCKRYAFSAVVRDGVQTVGGLGALATPPEHRGRGYARALCRNVCREYASEGIGVVVLWPFSVPFYSQMGWAVANDSYDVSGTPSALPSHDPAGSFRPMDADDWERLRPVEAATGEGVTLSMRRSEAWWRERTLTSWTGGTEPFVYSYERDGSVAGSLVYTVSDDDDGHERTLSVDAFGYVDREAHRSLLAFLARHGAQIDHIELQYPTHTRPLDIVDDPKAVTCERVPGPMARLTGLDPLGELDWSVLDRPITLDVSDPLLDATDGLLRVTEDGLERTSEGAADAEVDIGTLSQLYLGRSDPTTAERLGGLDITEESARDALAAVFPERPVHLSEFF